MVETDHNRQQCLELFARMSEYLDKELDEPTYRTIERHMAACPACKTCLATLKRTVDLHRAAGGFHVPRAMSKRLKAMCDELQKR